MHTQQVVDLNVFILSGGQVSWFPQTQAMCLATQFAHDRIMAKYYLNFSDASEYMCVLINQYSELYIETSQIRARKKIQTFRK